MKRAYIYILTLVFIAFIFSACDNEVLPNGTEEKKEWNGYIYFGAGDMERAPLSRATNIVESFDDDGVTDKNFSVITFQYSATSDWNTYKATGTPNPTITKFPFPTPVTYNSTNKYWTYNASATNGGTPLVDWDNSSRYTFFAYYPYNWTQLVTNSTSSTAGVPKITYTMPNTTNPADLRDVMIASLKDVQNTADGTVYFRFRHCLSCLTIDARNLDKEGEQGAAVQSIKNLTLYLTSNIYTSLSIPLDYSLEATASGTRPNASFTYSNTSTAIPVPLIANSGADEGKIQVISISQDNNVFLIPQKATGAYGHLKGYVQFTDKDNVIQTGNKSYENTPDYHYDQSLTFDSDKDFEAGRKYSLIINFANGKISVAIIESGDWTDKNITHTFE